MDTYTENVLSLYSGGGGLDIGFKLAVPNSRTVCYVEREVSAIGVLAKAMERGFVDNAPIWSDSSTFDSKPWSGKVDWVIGGFPCQPWSIAGKRKGSEDERWLWDDIRNIVSEIQPKGIFLENVSGLITGHGIDTILGSLSELGYDARWGNVKASDTGATHRRNRVFILAYKPGIGWRRWNDGNKRRSKQQVQTQGSFSECSSPMVNANKRRHGDKKEEIQSRGDSSFDASMENLEYTDSEQPNEMELYINNTVGTGFGDAGEKEYLSFPNFPPGPEFEGWREIIKKEPRIAPALEKTTLEPDLRGMVNGHTSGLHRIDQLRVLGNGIVPLQAAYAFRVLIGGIDD